MILNENGSVVQACWEDLPNHYPNVELGAFVVMPNHINGIIVLRDAPVGADHVGAGLRPAPTNTASTNTAPTGAAVRHGLPEIVRALKSFSARRINQINQSPGAPTWQRNYYEHIVRDEADFKNICLYIAANSQEWEQDPLHPQRSLL